MKDEPEEIERQRREYERNMRKILWAIVRKILWLYRRSRSSSSCFGLLRIFGCIRNRDGDDVPAFAAGIGIGLALEKQR